MEEVFAAPTRKYFRFAVKEFWWAISKCIPLVTQTDRPIFPEELAENQPGLVAQGEYIELSDCPRDSLQGGIRGYKH